MKQITTREDMQSDTEEPQSRIEIDDTAQATGRMPWVSGIAASAARWIARVLSIPIIGLFLVSLCHNLTDRTPGRLPAAGVIVVLLALGAGYVIAWWREDSGGVLVVAGVSCSLAGALSCNDPFLGYETMLGCVVTACFVVPGLLFLVSWGLRGSSTPLPPAPGIHPGSGGAARWRWIARATSLIALTYAMWLLAIVNLQRGTYGSPTSTWLSACLVLSILGGIAEWKYPRIASVLMTLSVVVFFAVLLQSDLERWHGTWVWKSDRTLHFAAMAMPLAVASLFQLVSAARRSRI
jgi:uncharacterized membrane protein YtjA (UPF0391 family)